MNKYLKYGLFGLGGLMLFAVTFTMVAVFSGAPLHEMAGIGMFIDPPEEEEGIAEATTGEEGAADPDAPVEPISGTDALMKNAGLLQAWSMPSPYTGSELHKLEKELTDQVRENSLERQRLRVRRLELDELEKTLTDKYTELADLRAKLEEFEGKLALREAELLRDESSEVDRRRQGWEDLAKIYEGGDAAQNAMLIAEEKPADGALILRALPEEEAGKILREITPDTLRKEFFDAYRAAAETP
jgi:flagellar motility protein MotE (MotC chaperone)